MKTRTRTLQSFIGIDEVGRGPLAGPITVCALYVEDEKGILKELFENTISDSKKLSKTKRINIYKTIRQKRLIKSKVEYAVASRSAAYIDKYGISAAAKACVSSCIEGLKRKGVDVEGVKIRLDAGLVVPRDKVVQESFIKGDERFVDIALASIVAKVTRDRYMERLSKLHKEYGWHKNVGYGTRVHREAIEKVGISKYHRKSYLKAFKLFGKAD